MSKEWLGVDLGTRTVSYDERDVMLYALAVGASATDLDLVFERDLRVLPTFALTLAQWAPDALAAQGAWDPATAVHGEQHLVVRGPLPPSGELTMSAHVQHVWDKGSAAIFDVAVDCAQFGATWSIFAPGRGGFGGTRGPSAVTTDAEAMNAVLPLSFADNQAALYRLTGDRHHIHIDPVAAAAIGQPRPILHGLCTLSAAVLCLAGAVGAHPADLLELGARFSGPVFPGSVLDLAYRDDGKHAVRFSAVDAGRPVLARGTAVFIR
ncbi:MAG: MaoC/PaaZ C-terminal domain-containing protein [Jatrophihabitans sp.]